VTFEPNEIKLHKWPNADEQLRKDENQEEDAEEKLSDRKVQVCYELIDFDSATFTHSHTYTYTRGEWSQSSLTRHCMYQFPGVVKDQ
jgi:hypothetical protein